MKRINNDEYGFIPLLITIVVIVAAFIYLAYTRVHHLAK